MLSKVSGVNSMNALERRSVQRKGWLGLAVLAAIPVIGIALLTASFSLFMVILLGIVLLGAFVTGGVLLRWQFRFGKRENTIAGVGPQSGITRLQ